MITGSQEWLNTDDLQDQKQIREYPFIEAARLAIDPLTGDTCLHV